jgi:tetratricopeptide (TPR) repeat protein
MKSALRERAEQYAQRGQVKQAIRLLKRAMQQGRASAEDYLRLAELYSQEREWRQAVWALRHARTLAPNSEQIREQLVEALLNADQYEEAIRECQNWLQEAPDHPIPLENLLDAYMSQNDFAHALTIANQLVQLQPLSPHYRMRRARLLDRMGRYMEAIEDYQWLVFDNDSTPFEVLLFAQLELERLDFRQMELLLHLVLDDSEFRVRFLQEPVEAARERGFRFSPVGETMITQLPDAIRDTFPKKRRYAPYC